MLAYSNLNQWKQYSKINFHSPYFFHPLKFMITRLKLNNTKIIPLLLPLLQIFLFSFSLEAHKLAHAKWMNKKVMKICSRLHAACTQIYDPVSTRIIFYSLESSPTPFSEFTGHFILFHIKSRKGSNLEGFQ